MLIHHPHTPVNQVCALHKQPPISPDRPGRARRPICNPRYNPLNFLVFEPMQNAFSLDTSETPRINKRGFGASIAYDSAVGGKHDK
jgi:hypothetical protein